MTSLCIVTGALPARADWSDNFDGGLHALWQFGSVDGAGNPSATFTAASVNDQLVMTDTLSAATGGAGAGFGLVLDILDNQRVAGVINPNGATDISATLTLLARGSFTAGGQFYAAEVNYDSGELIIFRNDSATEVVNLVAEPIPGLDRSESVYLEFDLVGDSLAVRAYDAPGGTLRQSVSVTDATYVSGLSGVLVNVNDPTSPILGVWDDVSATTIPEPATTVLILAALGGVMVLRRRR